jgi:hypothetical protein
MKYESKILLLYYLQHILDYAFLFFVLRKNEKHTQNASANDNVEQMIK